MTLRRRFATSALAFCWVGFLVPLAAGGGASGSTKYQVDPIPMRLDVDLEGQRYYVGENFPVTVRIVNPNGFDVYLRGFEFGALEPHMAIAFPGGVVFPGEEEFLDISLGGTISAMGGPPVLIPANGKIEHRRLVYSGTKLDKGHWLLMPAGVYRLKMKDSVGAITPDEPPCYTEVDWTSQVIEFTLITPGGRDLTALHFLREKASELAEHQRQPPPDFSSARCELDSYCQFIGRFPDSAYAPEIRWRLAKLLPSEVENPDGPLYDDPETVDLWDQCLTFCLDRGGAYAEEFLRLGSYSSAESGMNLAIKHKRFPLLKRIVGELDHKYPDEQDAILYRQVLVLAETASVEKARGAAATLAERFPDSEYVRRANHLLFWRERKKIE